MLIQPIDYFLLCSFILALLAFGRIVLANWVKLGLSAHDVAGALMTPGMVMNRNSEQHLLRWVRFKRFLRLR